MSDNNRYAADIHVVTATKDGKTEYWVAAVTRDQALQAVRNQAPPGWKLALIDDGLTPARVAELKMRPNSVRRLSGGL